MTHPLTSGCHHRETNRSYNGQKSYLTHGKLSTMHPRNHYISLQTTPMQTLHLKSTHADQQPTSTVSILSKLRQPSTTPIAVSEQKEMSINGGINDHECCRDVANQSPLHLSQNRNQSLEEGEESRARDEPVSGSSLCFQK